MDAGSARLSGATRTVPPELAAEEMICLATRAPTSWLRTASVTSAPADASNPSGLGADARRRAGDDRPHVVEPMTAIASSAVVSQLTGFCGIVRFLFGSEEPDTDL